MPTKYKPRDKGIGALKRFCRTLERLPEHERSAAVKYLADRYLGVKLWDRRF